MFQKMVYSHRTIDFSGSWHLQSIASKPVTESKTRTESITLIIRKMDMVNCQS